ncbi:MAG TPA: TolC family protein [Burkholderiaceae bacterium]|nr:TolC family protein [Burkholderiaceae bacterium]
MTPISRTPARAALAAATLALAGCASFTPDGGFAEVERLTRERTGQTPRLQRGAEPDAATRARLDALLAQPLSADAAVELALLNNRALQAQFAGLGIAEADRVQAGRLPNPTLRFGRLAGGGVTEIDRAVLVDVLGLLALPAASAAGQRGFEQAQWRAADDAVNLAAQARQAFFRAVAAQQLAVYAADVKDAADASSELARRMRAAGNFSRLAQMREQAFEADANAQLARARHQAVAERERLTRLLGLGGAAGPAFTLPDRLPDLPAQPIEPRDAEQTALDQRLDVQLAKRAAESTAASLGLTRATRFVNVLDAGWQNQSTSGEPRRSGYEIELVLPLFDFGQTRVKRAEAVYLQAMHRAAQVATDARSEVRESYSAYRTAYELARHYRDEVVPLRQRLFDENLLRYNGMLVSVFELLADAREQVGGVTAAVQALRDHWIAETQLRSALTGRSPAGAPFADSAAPAAPAAPAASH